jgi:ABC-2 type transport system permease protein
VSSVLNVMRHAFAAGLADYRSIFTWRSWVFGWMVRVISQVSFFGLIGLRVANDRSAFYLLIGNALASPPRPGSSR